MHRGMYGPGFAELGQISWDSTSIPHWLLRDLTRDGRWSTYDVSVLKLSNVSFQGKGPRMG